MSLTLEEMKNIEKWASNIEDEQTLEYVDSLLAEVKRLQNVEKTAIDVLAGEHTHGGISFDEFLALGGNKCPICLNAEVKRLQAFQKQLCPECLQMLEPDGSCLTCGMAKEVKRLREGIEKHRSSIISTIIIIIIYYSLFELAKLYEYDEELYKLLESK